MSALVKGFVVRQRLGVVAGLVWLSVACGLVAVVAQPGRSVADDAAKDAAPVRFTERAVSAEFARNIVKVRLTTALIANGIGLGYEHAFTKWFTVGAGIGTGFSSGIFDEDTYATGGDLIAFFMSEGDHKFVGGVGLALNYTHEKPAHYESSWFGDPTYVETEPGAWSVAPAFCVAYRYQPAAGGFFFQGGSALYGGLNAGLELNVGFVL